MVRIFYILNIVDYTGYWLCPSTASVEISLSRICDNSYVFLYSEAPFCYLQCSSKWFLSLRNKWLGGYRKGGGMDGHLSHSLVWVGNGLLCFLSWWLHDICGIENQSTPIDAYLHLVGSLLGLGLLNFGSEASSLDHNKWLKLFNNLETGKLPSCPTAQGEGRGSFPLFLHCC